ncbi:MAG: ZIP family metal transporter [Candidatus Poribacteria bacterium]|nr:ZIP family metal transporter [Candidatus Poribacteria bacterium]
MLLLIVPMGCSIQSETTRSTSGLAILIMLIMFAASLAAGAIPLLGIRTRTNLLRWATSLAAGFLISSALLVALPEGFRLVTGDESSTHISHVNERNTQRNNHNEVDGHEHNHRLPVRHSFKFGAYQTAGLALLMGFMLMLVIESLGFGHDLHEEHHHEDAGADHIHHPSSASSRGKGLATPIVIGLSIHALTDGLAMGAALTTNSISLTVPLMLGIVMHKMPAAFSLSAFSQHSHGNVRRTWKELIVFSLATPVALFIAWRVLGALESYWLGLAILTSAGTLLYVATVDVLPNVIHGANRRMVFLQVAIGTAVILALSLLLESLGLGIHPH